MNTKNTKKPLLFAAWAGAVAAAIVPAALAVLASASGRSTIAAAEAADVPHANRPVHAADVPASPPDYRKAVQRTADMTNDGAAQRSAGRFGLNIVNLTWEDTGRFYGSSAGPNISDMTIQVATRTKPGGPMQTTCMPVIRHPNFSDKTSDIDPRNFTLLVGNHKAGEGTPTLRRISLFDFLEDPTPYLSHPHQWTAKRKTLLAPDRDARVLVSAQACFLPVPKQGEAVFNPVLFNYQSEKNNPGVLTILATREGTSATIIDNSRDAFETGSVWGQRLFYNLHGQRASLTGKRESDFRASGGDALSGHIGPSVGPDQAGLNMVLLIQVPLKQKPRPIRAYSPMMMDAAPAGGAMKMARARRADESNVENAVIGHGEMEGPYTEMDNLPIERDPKFPVRVTVQFYKATDNGVVSKQDLTEIKEQIDRVYAHGDAIGSLVTGEGNTGRITEYEGAKVEPADWWDNFWARHQRETGDDRDAALAKLRGLLGQNYQNRPVTDLYLRNLLRRR